MTYIVQELNKPCQIVVFEVCYASRVFIPIQSAAELNVKPRRGLVKMVELLQDGVTWEAHGGFHWERGI
jgi:hypothetical protein